MMINAISPVKPLDLGLIKKQNTIVSNPISKVNPMEKFGNNDNGALKSYVLGGVNFGGKKKPDPIKNYVNNLPFADDLSPEDKRNLTNVLRKEDKETEYMRKMIHLVCKNIVTPMATASLCKNGQMSDFAKKDIDTYYDKVKNQKMSVKEAFVPMHSSQEEGQALSQVGDVFRVEGQENIFVKSGDNTSRQLKMDADMYLKLYPPVERFASCQGGTGDCYLLSSINAMMENPYTRASLYDCFNQKGNDIIMSIPSGRTSVLCPNGKLPKGVDYSKYTDGPMGMKLLEHAYGKELEAEKYEEYDEIVSKEFEKMSKNLKKWESKPLQDDLAIKKQNEIKARIENWKKGQAEVEAARNNPDNKKVFVLDDNLEMVIGKYGPMMEDAEKVDADYSNPSEYYCGGYGGIAEWVLQDFGFDSKTYFTGKNDKLINAVLFSKNPNDYIIAAGTPAEEEGEMESPQEIAYSIYSSHEYKVIPFDDENGNRMFKVTNPWNQSHQVIMDVEKLTRFFEEFSIAKVNAEA